ncbi:MAG: C4-dicarboxylate ABC transporter permease [Rhodospirillaceae bacterium]|nr:C4-dicarboxylate ABC transporter permease [Rhodospirillaceae bacterium]
MVLAVVSVSGRNFFNQPLPGYVDWIEQAMPLIAFMGVAYVQRYGAHIRMDLFLSQIKGRLLWTIEFGTTLTILLVMLVLVYGSYTHFDRSFDLDAPLWSRDSSMDIAIPLWPAKLLVPLAFAVLCLRLFLQLWAYGQAVFSGTKDPIAVPLIENAAQQAASEAASVSGYRDDTLGEDRPRV